MATRSENQPTRPGNQPTSSSNPADLYLTERSGPFAAANPGSTAESEHLTFLGNSINARASATMPSSSGTRPPPPPPPQQQLREPLPPGWSEHYDPASGRPFYANDATQETKWDRPAPYAVLPPDSTPAVYGPPGQQTQSVYAPHPSPYPSQPQYNPNFPPAHQHRPSYPYHHEPSFVAPGPSRVTPVVDQPSMANTRVDRGSSASIATDVGHVDDIRGLSSMTSALENAASIALNPDGVGSRLSLELSATNLQNKDYIGKSDPVVVVEIQEEGGRWKKIGQTEIIDNNLNPHWTRKISVDYCFEKVQLLQFTVYDVDRITRDGRPALKTKFLGQLTKALASILVSGTATYDLTGRPGSDRGKAYGRIAIRVHEDASNRSFYRVSTTLRASGLDKADRGLFAKSDPYVSVKQVSGAGQSGTNLLARTEIIKQDLNPKWKPLTFDVDPKDVKLEDVQLELVFTDWDKKSEHDPLGHVRISLGQLLAPGAGPFNVINPASSKYRSASYKNSGQLHVEQASCVEVPSHLQYLQGGCRLQVMCAVDMTATGGEIRDPGSPHFSNGSVPSLFSRALRAVGAVVAPFLPDDQMMMALGFGATHTYSNGVPSDAFPLNPAAFHSGDARVCGPDNLVAAYEACSQNVRFGQATNFAPIIGEAIRFSTSPSPSQEDQHYTVLLIFTNSSCDDYEPTVRKVVEASMIAPLSIVVVGVGDGRNWRKMKELDADNGRLPTTTDGLVASRDIVDFVEYDSSASPPALAADIFAEIPRGLREYMNSQRIKPNPPPQFVSSSAGMQQSRRAPPYGYR